MNLQKPYFVIFVFFISQFAYSQAPGYLGKRLTLDFQMGLSPAIENTTKSDVSWNKENTYGLGEENEGLALNHTYELHLNFAKNRIVSYGLFYTRLNTGFAFGFVERGYLEIKSNSLGLKLNQFKFTKGAIPPLGGNMGMGIERVFTKSNVTKGFMPVTPEKQTSFGFWNFLLEYQRNFIFLDRFIFKGSLMIRVPINRNLPIIFSDDLGKYKSRNDDLDEVFKEAFSFHRVAKHGLVRLNFGFGILL